MKQVGFHSLRHSFSAHLLEKAVNVKYIKDLLGHFDIRTTERYLHISNEKLVNIISPLDSIYKVVPDNRIWIFAQFCKSLCCAQYFASIQNKSGITNLIYQIFL